ncbi:hypothetical protein [Ferrovibrio sp.]|uniref:hypothetical protein n=1 Tax=Ferrovibrio sp. TaxID=1917215 RepID=UPI0035AE0AF2
MTYQPGVDVKGRPVAPADLQNGTSSILSQNFDLELKFTLAELLGPRAGAYAQGRAGAAQLTVGRLQFDPATGRLKLGDEPVQAPAQTAAEDAVLKACRAHLAKPPKR